MSATQNADDILSLWKKSPFSFSDEEIAKFKNQFSIYEKLLREYQNRMNLIGPSTLPDIWGRHFFQSSHILPFILDAQKKQKANSNFRYADIGSGAGFPGMICAILGQGAFETILIESAFRKAEFLEYVSCETFAPQTRIYNRRAESLAEKMDIISARAVARLTKLLDILSPLQKKETKILLFKGKNYQDELTEARKIWHFEYEITEIEPQSFVITIENAKKTRL